MRNSLTTATFEDEKVVDILMSKRRLKTQRKILGKSRDDKTSSSRPQKVKYPQTIELEEHMTHNEEGNNSDFIVDDFDSSDCEGMSNNSRDESSSDAESSLRSKNSYLQDVSDMQGCGSISLSIISAAEKGKNFYSKYDQNNEENSDLIRRKKASRLRLKPQRKCVSKTYDDKVNYQQSIPTNQDAHDNDVGSIEDLSQSEEGNLKGFIVDDFDVSSFEVTSSKSQDGVLCMKAVCALYRQQTSGEQMIKGTFCRNRRGLNKHNVFCHRNLAMCFCLEQAIS